jgi:hypothetical protein
VVVNDSRIAKKIAAVFETDWAHAQKVQAKAS